MNEYKFAPRMELNEHEPLIVWARDEAEARKLAMIKRYGSSPDAIAPHAPNYQGLGLILIR